MRRIYGARRINEETVQLLLFKNITIAGYKQYLKKGLQLPTENVIDATLVGYKGDIPECYQVDFSQYDKLPFNYKVQGTNKYIKELNPDELMQPVTIIPDTLYKDIGDWLIYKGKALCYLPQEDWRVDTKGYEISEDNILSHSIHTEISVMHEGKRRYRKDEEIQDFYINLNNSSCTYRHKYFNGEAMIDAKYVFDSASRFWVLQSRTVDNNIVAVKRR